jgi:2,5-diamino-6-(ribosylamino)-4(3H)-pyrimidinone 5'-phosphate reductase
VGADAPAARLRQFESRCEIIQLAQPRGARSSTAKQVIRALEQRGYRKLLVEGGGQVMWDFVKDNLIDEYHVTLTPKLIGGTKAPTLVDGPGFEPSKVLNLKLKKCVRAGDELYLTYVT